MSDTIILSGICSGDDVKEAGPAAAAIIRHYRSKTPGLSRFEHDICAGIEADLMQGGEGDPLGFVGTATAVAAIPALVKSGALKRVFGFIGRIKDRAKKRAAKRAAKKGKPIKEDGAIIAALTNVQAKCQAGAAKYSAAAEAIENGINPATGLNPAAPESTYPGGSAMPPAVQQQPGPGRSLFIDEGGKPTVFTLSLLAAAVLMLTKSRGGK